MRVCVTVKGANSGLLSCVELCWPSECPDSRLVVRGVGVHDARIMIQTTSFHGGEAGGCLWKKVTHV